MLYLFHGSDEYSIQQAVAGLKAQLGDPEMVSLNTTVLDGRRAAVSEIISACDTLPFLTQHRLVIVDGLLAQWGRGRSSEVEPEEPEETPAAPGNEAAAQFRDYLERLPETTTLVLIEEKIDGRSAIVKLAQRLQGEKRAVVKEFKPLDKGALVRWVQRQAQDGQGRIEDRAAVLLVDLVGDDLRLLGQETDKLLAYAGGSRAITAADVETMCSYTPEANVFHMVDALGRRDRQTALKLLHALLDEGQAALYLLAMITRQFRILLSIKDLSQRGVRSDAIAGQLKLIPFVADKGLAQARNFSLVQLERIYQWLVEIDIASKTGEMDPALALDLFVVEACRGS